MTEMRDVDHTHPNTGEAFGSPHAAGRVAGSDEGTVAADGGVADADDGDDGRHEMRDVDHESPGEAGVDRAFERGTEGRDESV